MALGECSCENATGNIAELPNTTWMVVFQWVLHDAHTSPNQLQILYTAVRHWEKVIDSIEATGGLMEPCHLKVTMKCTLEQKQSVQEHWGLHILREPKSDLIHDQISLHCWLLNAFKLKLELNVKIILIQMRAAIERRMRSM